MINQVKSKLIELTIFVASFSALLFFAFVLPNVEPNSEWIAAREIEVKHK